MGPISVFSLLVSAFYLDKAITYRFRSVPRRPGLSNAYLIVSVPFTLVGILAMAVGL